MHGSKVAFVGKQTKLTAARPAAAKVGNERSSFYDGGSP
jgi:hypothetical protein